jgi:hypothetical protein
MSVLYLHVYLSSPEKNTAYTVVDVVKLGITFWAAVNAPVTVTNELPAVKLYCDDAMMGGEC